MTIQEARAEAQKLTDQGYFWSTVIANVPDQVIKSLFAEGIYTRDQDHVIITIQNLIDRGEQKKLKSILSRIKFDFDRAPEGYHLAIQEFYNLINPRQ